MQICWEQKDSGIGKGQPEAKEGIDNCFRLNLLCSSFHFLQLTLKRDNQMLEKESIIEFFDTEEKENKKTREQKDSGIEKGPLETWEGIDKKSRDNRTLWLWGKCQRQSESVFWRVRRHHSLWQSATASFLPRSRRCAGGPQAEPENLIMSRKQSIAIIIRSSLRLDAIVRLEKKEWGQSILEGTEEKGESIVSTAEPLAKYE